MKLNQSIIGMLFLLVSIFSCTEKEEIETIKNELKINDNFFQTQNGFYAIDSSNVIKHNFGSSLYSIILTNGNILDTYISDNFDKKNTFSTDTQQIIRAQFYIYNITKLKNGITYNTENTHNKVYIRSWIIANELEISNNVVINSNSIASYISPITLNITKNEDIYIINYTCTSINGEDIKGNYTGTLKNLNYLEK